MAKLLGNFVVSSGSRMAVGKHGVEPGRYAGMPGGC